MSILLVLPLLAILLVIEHGKMGNVVAGIDATVNNGLRTVVAWLERGFNHPTTGIKVTSFALAGIPTAELAVIPTVEPIIEPERPTIPEGWAYSTSVVNIAAPGFLYSTVDIAKPTVDLTSLTQTTPTVATVEPTASEQTLSVEKGSSKPATPRKGKGGAKDVSTRRKGSKGQKRASNRQAELDSLVQVWRSMPWTGVDGLRALGVREGLTATTKQGIIDGLSRKFMDGTLGKAE